MIFLIKFLLFIKKKILVMADFIDRSFKSVIQLNSKPNGTNLIIANKSQLMETYVHYLIRAP
jgi:hypothetical protein